MCFQVTSIAMDGADQSAHNLPKTKGRIPKGLTPWPQKLQCVLMHGIQIAMFNVLHVVHSGANMAMSCLLSALQVMNDSGNDLQSTVYLQVDGGSENWNQVLFAWVDLWFDYYPHLDEVIISRLPVGHTHIDIDRFFSYLNAKLFGTGRGRNQTGVDVITKEAFVEKFMEAMVDNRDTMLLAHKFQEVNAVFDFWGWLKPHLCPQFSGYGSAGNVHVMRFQRRTGSSTPHVSYKYWHQSPQWLPADGSSLKILNTRPDLADLKTMKVEQHVPEHQEVLVRHQKPLLKWLLNQQSVGLVSEADVTSWKMYFKSLGQYVLCVTWRR